MAAAVPVLPAVLTLDIGNTAAKFGLFAGGKLLRAGVVTEPAGLRSEIENVQVQRAIACSVAADPAPFRDALPADCPFTLLTAQLPLPLRLAYDTPQTLGMDRLAAVAGAQWLFPGQPVLVLDAGTCLTYDLLTSDGIYRGGAISPGLQMRFQALHTFTARLPLVPQAPAAPLTGKSTADSISSGVQNGLLAEARVFRAQYSRLYPGLVTVLCGGDAGFFETNLAPPTFAVPELVLMGLYHISEHVHA